jgi:transcriptional regulator with XRE-family HTH domain
MPTATADPNEVAVRVRRLRAERGWRQHELAAKANIANRTIQKIEAGGRAHDSTYGRVAAALGIPLAQLLGEEE